MGSFGPVTVISGTLLIVLPVILPLARPSLAYTSRGLTVRCVGARALLGARAVLLVADIRPQPPGRHLARGARIAEPRLLVSLVLGAASVHLDGRRAALLRRPVRLRLPGNAGRRALAATLGRLLLPRLPAAHVRPLPGLLVRLGPVAGRVRRRRERVERLVLLAQVRVRRQPLKLALARVLLRLDVLVVPEVREVLGVRVAVVRLRLGRRVEQLLVVQEVLGLLVVVVPQVLEVADDGEAVLAAGLELVEADLAWP